MNTTAQGRAQNREAVLRYCINGNMAPGPAIVELEREYTFTSLD